MPLRTGFKGILTYLSDGLTLPRLPSPDKKTKIQMHRAIRPFRGLFYYKDGQRQRLPAITPAVTERKFMRNMKSSTLPLWRALRTNRPAGGYTAPRIWRWGNPCCSTV